MGGKKVGSGKKATAGRGSTKESGPAEKSVKSPLWTPGGPLEITDAIYEMYLCSEDFGSGAPLFLEGNLDGIEFVDDSELLEVLDDTLVPESSFEVFDLYRRSPEVIKHVIYDSPAVLEPLTHDTVFVTRHDIYNKYVYLHGLPGPTIGIHHEDVDGPSHVNISFHNDNFAYTIMVPCEISYRKYGPTRYELVRIPAQDPANLKFLFEPYREKWNDKRGTRVGEIFVWAGKSQIFI